MHLCISRFSKWLKRVNTFLRHPHNWHHSAAVLWTLCSIVQLRSLATRGPHAQSKACLILFKLYHTLEINGKLNQNCTYRRVILVELHSLCNLNRLIISLILPVLTRRKTNLLGVSPGLNFSFLEDEQQCHCVHSKLEHLDWNITVYKYPNVLYLAWF